jgi:hypothetical protein
LPVVVARPAQRGVGLVPWVDDERQAPVATGARLASGPSGSRPKWASYLVRPTSNRNEETEAQ